MFILFFLVFSGKFEFLSHDGVQECSLENFGPKRRKYGIKVDITIVILHVSEVPEITVVY